MTLAKPNYFMTQVSNRCRYIFILARQTNTGRKCSKSGRELNSIRKRFERLSLRDTSESNRLTLDYGNDRIDVGVGLTEVEREWLFRLLKTEYRLNFYAKSKSQRR